jgi:osmotically inducible protein OsmC
MALNAALRRAGKQPASITTTATVHMTMGDGTTVISGITLTTRGVVPGLSAAEFQKFAEDTKTGCIVSKALSAVPMTLDAQLVSD